MSGWRTHTGQAIALPIDNVDTDQIIPARFMSTPRSAGYGQFLMHDLRETVGFPLNDAPGASILIAGRNFGSGSSREAAVYTLMDAGFRVVIAESFGDIFVGNAINNGLLPATVSAPVAQALLQAFAQPGSLSIDVARRSLSHPPGAAFSLGDVAAEKLMNGWDDIDLTAAHAEDIDRFRARYPYRSWANP